VHTALQLAPVLAAEKSKVPFYIAGGALVVWALGISMLVGMRRTKFPETDGQQRLVMGVSAVLVLAALVTAVVTGSSPEKETANAAQGGGTSLTTTAKSTTPEPAAAPTATTTAPKATTGTPPPASSPAAKAQKIALSADPSGQLAFSTTQLKAKAGTVDIEFENASPVEHDVTIEQGNKKVLGATPTFVGGKKSLTLKLAPGTYTFFCSVPGHRQAGMEGKLVVGS
jgi:plastocyanin